MKRLAFLLICAVLGLAETPRPVIPVPGGDPHRTNAPASNQLRIIWGNYVWPDAPAPPPTFKAIDFTGFSTVSPRFVDRHVKTNATTRVGQYEFAARTGVRQVMWIPDALGPPIFTVSGFPWQLTPTANQPCQALTISSVPGHVYLTSEQNSGGQSIATHDPIVIQ